MSVTWKGLFINGPKLIYQDEMNDNPLECVSSSQSQVGWHSAGGQLVSTTSMTNHYRQERTSRQIPSIAWLIANRPNDPLTSTASNGLWSCRKLNQGGGYRNPLLPTPINNHSYKYKLFMYRSWQGFYR